MHLCDYGCGLKANYKFKNGKYCCSKHSCSCPEKRKNNPSKRNDIKEKKRQKLLGHFVSEETKKKISEKAKGRPSPRKGKKLSEEQIKKMSEFMKGKTPWNKGVPHTEKTKRKLKEAWKGRVVSEQTRKKLSEIGKGRTLSEETKQKLRNRICTEETREKLRKSTTGRKHSEETKRKLRKENLSLETRRRISLAKMGPNNPSWKGGASFEPYCPLWVDQEYKQSIKLRDGNICLNPYCNKTINKLCIHHIDYNKKNCCPENLITLCSSCNAKANFDREWHQDWYKTIIKNRYLTK
jgi:hypothetical protein